jgi:hypothetical protein
MVINLQEVLKKQVKRNLSPYDYFIYRDKTSGGIHYTVYTRYGMHIGNYYGTFLVDEMDERFQKRWEDHIISGLEE